ncbi:MAG: demethoxyubiquinone hydroxylase family protein [Candidatus Midichloria sp.]|nr:MAG: demethoxyubiquinone hydroxylase family protein [Candidatus Midichloria sp.]
MSKKIAEIIRVNQAGEYGAKRIYEGQMAALSEPTSLRKIEHMYKQELEHLNYFNLEMVKKRVRPTFMLPIWNIGAYALGYISGKFGIKAAMACIAAVEEVIEGHYQDHIDYLENYKEEQALKEKIKKFQSDEVEHKITGLNSSTEELHYQIFKVGVRSLTRVAIKISKKI